MDPIQTRAQVAALFRRGARRGRRVGVEQEFVVRDAATGASVPVTVIRRLADGADYADHLTFEPGGQVELSLPCAASPEALAQQLVAEVGALRADCQAHGIELLESPVDPRAEAAVPLQLNSARYLSMQAHFDRIGPAGRRMMRRTASTQVCLDWWPGGAGLEQWRLLNVAGPILAAALARSCGAGSRLATWLAVDQSRTAFDDRLVCGDDPVAAYADFAAGATVFTAPGDVAEHLSTLFPPVRPRGRYLEVRFLDVQPTEQVGAVAGVLSRLLYDDEIRAQAWRRVGSLRGRLAEQWERAALGDDELRARGLDLISLASRHEPGVLVSGAA